MDGKPHLGTDKLVLLLKEMRKGLEALGATFLFGQCVDSFVTAASRSSAPTITSNKVIQGVKLKDGTVVPADVLVLATGHSSRTIFQALVDVGVDLIPKPFACGFRVEHPQGLIDQLQLGPYASLVERGSGKVPVADYRLATEVWPTVEGGGGGTGTAGSSLAVPRPVYSFCMCPGGQIGTPRSCSDTRCLL